MPTTEILTQTVDAGRGVRRLAFLTGVAGALLVPATPAFAHGGDAPDATAYRTRVIGVSTPERGLTVRAVEAGSRLELTNRTGHSVEVLGYSGEPYLDVRPDGTYQNDELAGRVPERDTRRGDPRTAAADPTAPPAWRRISTATTVRWHDQRTRWLGPGLPPAAAADPTRAHRLRDWAVPLRVQVRTFEIRGTLDWEPPPRAWLWWSGAGLCLLTVAAIARRWPRSIAPLAAPRRSRPASGTRRHAPWTAGPSPPSCCSPGCSAGRRRTGTRRSSWHCPAPSWPSSAVSARRARSGRGAADRRPGLARPAVRADRRRGWSRAGGDRSAGAARGPAKPAARAAVVGRRSIVVSMTETVRLSPGDAAPDFTLPTDTGDRLALQGPARAQGGAVRVPGRDDTGLHHPGLRLPRLAGLTAGGRLRGGRHLPRQAGQAGQVPRTRRHHVSAGQRRGQERADGVRRVRREVSCTARR